MADNHFLKTIVIPSLLLVTANSGMGLHRIYGAQSQVKYFAKTTIDSKPHLSTANPFLED